MELQQNNEPRTCIYCDKAIHGRSEKKFCGIDCKNNYNSRKKAELKAQGTAHQGAILKIIKNNYQILLPYKSEMGRSKTKTVAKQELFEKGFDSTYFTSCIEQPGKGLCKCCFDICYFELEDNRFELHYAQIECFVDEDSSEEIMVFRRQFD